MDNTSGRTSAVGGQATTLGTSIAAASVIFTAPACSGTTSIATVTLPLSKTDNLGTQAVYLDLFTVDGSNSPVGYPASPLHRVQIPNDLIISSSTFTYKLITIDFVKAISPGTKYALVLSVPSATSSVVNWASAGTYPTASAFVGNYFKMTNWGQFGFELGIQVEWAN